MPSQRLEPGHAELRKMLAVGSMAMLWPDWGSLFFIQDMKLFASIARKK